MGKTLILTYLIWYNNVIIFRTYNVVANFYLQKVFPLQALFISKKLTVFSSFKHLFDISEPRFVVIPYSNILPSKPLLL